jgi:hypothetical protein
MMVIRLALNCPFKFVTDSWNWAGVGRYPIDDRLHMMQKEPFFTLYFITILCDTLYFFAPFLQCHLLFGTNVI